MRHNDQYRDHPQPVGAEAYFAKRAALRADAAAPRECHAGCDLCGTLNEMDADDAARHSLDCGCISDGKQTLFLCDRHADISPRPAPPSDAAAPPTFTGQMDWPCTCGHTKAQHHFGDLPGGDGSYRPWCQMTLTCKCYAFTPSTLAPSDAAAPLREATQAVVDLTDDLARWDELNRYVVNSQRDYLAGNLSAAWDRLLAVLTPTADALWGDEACIGDPEHQYHSHESGR